MKRNTAELEQEKKELRAVLAALFFIGLGNNRTAESDAQKLQRALVLANDLL